MRSVTNDNKITFVRTKQPLTKIGKSLNQLSKNGGKTSRRTWIVGRAAQKPMILVAKVARTGSMVEKMVPQLPPERRNSVIAARMRTSDSARTSLKAASKLARLATSMTWAFFMLTRDAMFNPVMFRRTFESPITEKSPDMIGVCVSRTPPEIGCSENFFLICVVPE